MAVTFFNNVGWALESMGCRQLLQHQEFQAKIEKKNKCTKLLRRHGASGIMTSVCTQCVLEHKVFISATSRFDGGTLTHRSANSFSVGLILLFFLLSIYFLRKD